MHVLLCPSRLFISPTPTKINPRTTLDLMVPLNGFEVMLGQSLIFFRDFRRLCSEYRTLLFKFNAMKIVSAEFQINWCPKMSFLN